MRRVSPAPSAASRVFLVLLGAVLLIGALVAVFLVIEAQRATLLEAERVTAATAATVARSPAVVDALASGDDEEATRALEPYALDILAEAGLGFVTVMNADGIRVTHPDLDEIGRPYLGTVPDRPEPLTEVFTGTLGPSVRTIVPVVTGVDRLVGWVAIGVTTESIADTFVRRLPLSLAITAVLVALGAAGAWLARRVTRRGAAGTRPHGGGGDILTETSRQSQSLVDEVTARRHSDPAVGALLLGKASQAKERGIDWRVRIDPETPRSALSPMDSISVLGNLVDNAMDAAGESSERWVQVVLSRSPEGGILLEVSDSGAGVPEDLRERIFAHGYSTKPAGTEGRGVGLALVRSIVVDAGGSVQVLDHPTTSRVRLPAQARGRRRP